MLGRDKSNGVHIGRIICTFSIPSFIPGLKPSFSAEKSFPPLLVGSLFSSGLTPQILRTVY